MSTKVDVKSYVRADGTPVSAYVRTGGIKELLAQLGAGANMLKVGDLRIAIIDHTKSANPSDRGYKVVVRGPNIMQEMQGVEPTRAAAVLEGLRQYHDGNSVPKPKKIELPKHTAAAVNAWGGTWEELHDAGNRIARTTLDDPDSEEAQANWKDIQQRKKDWEVAIGRAISTGEIESAEAAERFGLPKWMDDGPEKDGTGYLADKSVGSGSGRWEPLPPKLYHATGSLSAIRESGSLKARDELGQSKGAGLGGGADNTISFTESLDTAYAIATSIREAHGVASGQITVADMLAEAERDDFVPEFMSYWSRSGWEKGDPYPEIIQRMLDGDYPLHQMYAWPEDGGMSVKDGPPRPDPIQDTWDIYQWFQYAREGKTGQLNPVFFSSDLTALANTDPAEIGVVVVEPANPRAKGVQLGALGEWRVPTGEAVKITDTVNYVPMIAKHLGPLHDQRTHGRKRLAGAWPDVPGFIDNKLKTSGGLTAHRFSGYEPTEGYSVALDPGMSLEIMPNEPDDQVRDEIIDWVNRHTRKRGPSFDDKKVYIGGWVDPDSGHIWMDVVSVWPPDQLDQAKKAAAAANQIALYDLKNGVEVPIGGTGQVTKSERQRFIAPINVNPLEFADWVMMLRSGVGEVEKKLVIVPPYQRADGTWVDGYTYDTKRRHKLMDRFVMATRRLGGKKGRPPSYRAPVAGVGLNWDDVDPEIAAELKPKMAQRVINEVAGFQDLDELPDDQKYDAVLQRMRGNISRVADIWDQMGYGGRGEVNTHWYDAGRKLCDDTAKKYDLDSHEIVAAVIAVLSPQSDWNVNVEQALKIIDTVKLRGDQPLSGGEISRYNELVLAKSDRALEAWNNAKAKAERKGTNFNRVKPDWPLVPFIEHGLDVTLNDLSDEATAYGVRAMNYTDGSDSIGYHRMRLKGGDEYDLSEVAKKSDGTDDHGRWQTYENITKAISLLRDQSDENQFAQLMGAQKASPKVPSFRNNLAYPDSAQGDVTIDTHALGIALGIPITATHPHVATGPKKSDKGHIPWKGRHFKPMVAGGSPPSNTFEGISSGVYMLVADAYRQEAEDRHMVPRKLQSTTWAAWKVITPEGWRQEKNIAGVEELMRDAADGKLTDKQGNVLSYDDVSAENIRELALTNAGEFDKEAKGLD